MADEALSQAGLHVDDLNKIRLLEPEVTQQATELRDQCKDFVGQMREFQRIVQSFIDVVDQTGVEVEKEKMKAIALRSLLQSAAKQREGQYQQLLSQISEKKQALEKLRVEHELLQKREAEQNELIEQFMSQK